MKGKNETLTDIGINYFEFLTQKYLQEYLFFTVTAFTRRYN